MYVPLELIHKLACLLGEIDLYLFGLAALHDVVDDPENTPQDYGQHEAYHQQFDQREALLCILLNFVHASSQSAFVKLWAVRTASPFHWPPILAATKPSAD